MRKKALSALWLSSLVCSASALGQLEPRQDGLIHDEMPMEYASAEDALERLPSRPGIESVRHISEGITQYSSGVSELTSWYAFGKGSYAYPTVVRNRVVGPPDNFIVKTTILCGASPDACAQVEQMFASARATER